MSDLIRVVVADDNDLIRQMIVDSLSDDPLIEVVGEAADGRTAISIIKETKPDAVLLDLVMPGPDGIAVMEEVKSSGIFAKDKPYFIVVSAAGKEDIISQALQTGAAYFFMKPFDGEVLAKRIKQICTNSGITPKDISTLRPENKQEDTIDNKVATLLRNLGISVRMVGYKYLRDAICLAYNDEEALMSVTKNIYPEIADMHDTSSGNVERNIRYVVESMWNKRTENSASELFINVFHNMEKKPTNSEFILLCTEWIKYGR